MSKSNRLDAGKRSLAELRKQLVAYLEEIYRLDMGTLREQRIASCIELMGNPKLKPVPIVHKKCVKLLSDELQRLSEGDSSDQSAAKSVAKKYPELVKAPNAKERRAVKASGQGMAVV